jgi:HAD superfamily hydrolase (TIGR01509 family)
VPGAGGGVEAVVFDIGGVLLDWNPRYLYEQLIDDPVELDRFLAEVCTLEWNAIFDAGTSFADGCAALAAEHPEHADLIHAWERQADMVRGEIEGTRLVVERLHAAGIPLYLLTNMPADVFEERRRTYDIFSFFGGEVVSGVDGVLKPEPAIFELVLERFGLDPSTTLFIDDSLRNVEAAAALGFVTHHFTDAASLAVFVDEVVALGR